MNNEKPAKGEPDLSPTALYTAEVWGQGKFHGSDWFCSRETRFIFRIVQCFLWIQRLFRRSLPRLKEGLLLRHSAFDILMKASEASTIVEVASGLSSRFARYLSHVETGLFVEVDLPSMVETKERLLSDSAGASWLEDARYVRLSGDARDFSHLDLPIGPSPTLVLVEGLMMYFTPDEQTQLLADIAKTLERNGGGTVLFDLVPSEEEPAPGILGRWMARQMERWTQGGHFNRIEQTRLSIQASMRRAGFTEVECFEPGQLPELKESSWNLVETKQVLFKGSIGRLNTP